jgi:hypothetical protein
MKAKEFINEEEVKPYKKEVLDLDTAMQVLNTHCSNAVRMLKKPIWRGMRDNYQQIIFADPSTGKRNSHNTTNQYTVLMSTSPHMVGWPKRDASFICSTGVNYASSYSYGNSGVYAIFPFDGVKIAMCPHKDMWETDITIPAFNKKFTGNPDNMSEFNYWLQRDFGISGTPNSIKNAHANKRVISFCKSHKVDPKNFIPILQKALSPENAKFELLTVDQYLAGAYKNKECWIGGPVVAIRIDLYKKFLSAYKKNES